MILSPTTVICALACAAFGGFYVQPQTAPSAVPVSPEPLLEELRGLRLDLAVPERPRRSRRTAQRSCPPAAPCPPVPAWHFRSFLWGVLAGVSALVAARILLSCFRFARLVDAASVPQRIQGTALRLT